MHITVKDNNVEQAIRILKKKLQREGVFKEMKSRRYFEKPSQERVREAQETKKRIRRAVRQRKYL